MISWKGTYLQPIINGDYDTMIRARARALRKFGHWIFMRWGWEMNGDWEDWSGANNQPHGPAKFVQAWRHIREIFWQENAWNVVFVWAPNDGNLPRAKWNNFTHYYPGNKYVDWVGVDGFNWGKSHWWSEWLTIEGILHDVYQKYHWSKPIMVAETGSVEQGGNKAKWIRHMGRVIRTKFPAVAAVIYFNGTTPDNADFRLSTSRSAMAAFRAVANDPYWSPSH
jgi:beta-mannanase